MDIDLKDQIKNKYESLLAQEQTSDADLITELRSTAYAAFERLGFPTVKNEDWKYTNVKPYLKDDYRFNSQAQYNGNLKSASYFGKGLKAYTILLVNGIIQPELSNLPDAELATVRPLDEVLNNQEVASVLAQSRKYEINPFLALNSALFQGGIFIEIKKNVVLDKPIHLVHLGLSDNHYFQNTKNVFFARTGSQAQIVESFENISDHDALVFRNAASEITVAANAKLEHYKLQKGSDSLRLVEHNEIHQGPDSQYNNYTFTLPGYAFVRNNLNLALEGSNIESHMYGLYLTDDHQLVDNHTLVDHQQPHCESNQLYKGIMMGQSKAVFNGKVYVHPIAQKTNAFQSNNNILFSDQAAIYSKPQLEIFADDVKCSHGTTIGQLDPEALFYLKSRGINEEDGRSLLVNAFAFDVSEKIENEEIKTLLNSAISETMLGVPALL